MRRGVVAWIEAERRPEVVEPLRRRGKVRAISGRRIRVVEVPKALLKNVDGILDLFLGWTVGDAVVVGLQPGFNRFVPRPGVVDGLNQVVVVSICIGDYGALARAKRTTGREGIERHHRCGRQRLNGPPEFLEGRNVEAVEVVLADRG